MIKGNFPSIIVKSNTLIVSRIGESKFNISEGIIYLGGHSIFFETQTIDTDSISFPFRIGIEIEGLPTSTYQVKTYNITQAGKTLEPADVPSFYKEAPIPDNFSNSKVIPIAYNFDNRQVKNPFKSLATVEQYKSSIIINQHSYGPLRFKPFQHYTYKDDYIFFADRRALTEGSEFYTNWYSIPDQLFLK